MMTDREVRRLKGRFWIVWGITLALLLVVACAGSRARDAAVQPMRGAFDAIATQALRGASEVGPMAELVASIRTGLDAGDRTALRGLNWAAVRAAAEVDIRWRALAGEISDGVAESLLERLRLFDETWAEVIR